jgi:hypothetical protein
MREVAKEIILRAIKMAKRKGRTISSSKAARGRGVDVATLDPRTPRDRGDSERSSHPSAASTRGMNSAPRRSRTR